MKELRLGIVGTFGHTPNVLNDVRATEGVRVAALARDLPDDSFAALRGHAAVGDEPREFDSPQAMFEAGGIDAAVVGTRLDRIAPAAMAAAQAGCHVICEKPLAIEHEALSTLWKTIEESGVQCMAMLNARSMPAMAAARSVVMAGEIGDVVMANARKSYKWGGRRPGWFGRRAEYGGTIGWVGIHAFDFINYVTGRTFAAVAALQSNATKPDYADCEDNCALVLELDNGAHGVVSIDYLRPQAAPTHGDDWIRIVGSKGVLEANASKGTCEVIDADGPRVLEMPEPVAVYRPFFECLMGRPAEVVAGARESFLLTQACLCARDAADGAQVVRIPDAPWL